MNRWTHRGAWAPLIAISVLLGLLSACPEEIDEGPDEATPAPVEPDALEGEVEDIVGADLDMVMAEEAPAPMSSGARTRASVTGPPPGEPAGPDFQTESYDSFTENPFLAVKSNPLSTFSIDVDTAGYANVRRLLRQGSAPPSGAVRVEELVNYFSSASRAVSWTWVSGRRPTWSSCST